MTEQQEETLGRICERSNKPYTASRGIQVMRESISEDHFNLWLRGFLTHPDTLKAVWGTEWVDVMGWTEKRFTEYMKNEWDKKTAIHPWERYEERMVFHGEYIVMKGSNESILDYYTANWPKEKI